jgi:GNAT superfamily N-acetyltransferase
LLTKARTPGVVIRPGTDADAPRLAEIERDSPTVGGSGTTFTIDRGRDNLAGHRIQPAPVLLVAEMDGEVVGAQTAAVHASRMGGQDRTLAWIHYPLVPPPHRGKAIGRALQAETQAFCRPLAEACYRLVPAGYDPHDGTRPWRGQPVWLLLDCHRVAGPRHGRRATRDDADLIVEILNAAHRHEELYLPLTTDSLIARLERSPADYGWDNLLLGDGAVVGVWRGGWRVQRIHDDRPFFGFQDNVLDFGFLPGAEGELVRLLRAACGEEQDEVGERFLGLWSSAGSLSYASVASLTAREFPFTLWADTAEPGPGAGRGIYLDCLQT